jgi:Predicted AAA-ATPase
MTSPKRVKGCTIPILAGSTTHQHQRAASHSPSTSISLYSSTGTYFLCSCFSVGLPHSSYMPTVGNLHISLRRRFAIPTSPTLLYASLRRYRYARIPLVAYRTSFAMSSSSKLLLSGKLKRFPFSISNFSEIHEPGVVYFDKTEYIAELENGTDVQLLCRPRRFGKSLTVTMLRCFHGFQFRNQYDQLFKVCGTLFGQDLHAHITYAKLGSRRG